MKNSKSEKRANNYQSHPYHEEVTFTFLSKNNAI